MKFIYFYFCFILTIFSCKNHDVILKERNNLSLSTNKINNNEIDNFDYLHPSQQAQEIINLAKKINKTYGLTPKISINEEGIISLSKNGNRLLAAVEIFISELKTKYPDVFISSINKKITIPNNFVPKNVSPITLDSSTLYSPLTPTSNNDTLFSTIKKVDKRKNKFLSIFSSTLSLNFLIPRNNEKRKRTTSITSYIEKHKPIARKSKSFSDLKIKLHEDFFFEKKPFEEKLPKEFFQEEPFEEKLPKEFFQEESYTFDYELFEFINMIPELESVKKILNSLKYCLSNKEFIQKNAISIEEIKNKKENFEKTQNFINGIIKGFHLYNPWIDSGLVDVNSSESSKFVYNLDDITYKVEDIFKKISANKNPELDFLISRISNFIKNPDLLFPSGKFLSLANKIEENSIKILENFKNVIRFFIADKKLNKEIVQEDSLLSIIEPKEYTKRKRTTSNATSIKSDTDITSIKSAKSGKSRISLKFSLNANEINEKAIFLIGEIAENFSIIKANIFDDNNINPDLEKHRKIKEKIDSILKKRKINSKLLSFLEKINIKAIAENFNSVYKEAEKKDFNYSLPSAIVSHIKFIDGFLNPNSSKNDETLKNDSVVSNKSSIGNSLEIFALIAYITKNKDNISIDKLESILDLIEDEDNDIDDDSINIEINDRLFKIRNKILKEEEINLKTSIIKTLEYYLYILESFI